MIIQNITTNISNIKNTNLRTKTTTPATSSCPTMLQKNELSNFYYQPKQNNAITFKGLWFEKNIVKKVTGKKFQGAALYKKGGWLDFSKIGSEFLSKEPLDITKATDNEVYAHWHASSLAETHDSTWVRRYNKYNVPAPLAVFRTLSSQKAQEAFADNLKKLHDTSRHKSLDAPITDKKGNFVLDCVVFDTETTGLNLHGPQKPLDRIVQIGAIQVKKGKVAAETAYDKLINPEMPIPKQAADVHGITDDKVADKPPIEAILKPFTNDYLNKKNGVIVAYNSKFDITILNNAIREHNDFTHQNLKEKQAFKVLDPFILIQRIHPYMGARKKLGEQYKFLFCKEMDNAHDAFADVKGTVDVMKYCLYQLSEHRKDKTKPLTLREVLVFQNGGKAENIDMPLDHKGCNANVNFDQSYRQIAVAVDDYFMGYKLSSDTLNELEKEIGPKNATRLKEDKVPGALIDLNPKDGHPINPAETKLQPKNSGVENAFFVMKRNFKKILGFAKLEPYKDRSKEEIEELITKKSEHYLHKDAIDLWVKNPNPEDIKDGNDLPNIDIARRVMREQSES